MVKSKRTPVSKLIGLFGGVVVVAALSCYLTLAWMLPKSTPEPGLDGLLQEMDLREEHTRDIDAVNADFERRRQELLDAFYREQQTLAQLLRDEEAFSPVVEEAVVDIHHIHGQLQTLSIERYFAILEVLPPEQRADLRELEAATLSQPD